MATNGYIDLSLDLSFLSFSLSLSFPLFSSNAGDDVTLGFGTVAAVMWVATISSLP